MHRVRSFSLTRKKTKYKNQPRDYAGNQYHSIKEAKYAMDLDWRKKAGEIKEWHRQKKIMLYAYGIHICDYYIDFVVLHQDGRVEYVEVKGFETDTWRLKWKLFEAQMQTEHPEALLTIIR
jgi:hypothetical protein